ncbi:lytic murein transglycosylase [Sporosarcina sp. Te-1]|uniref:lytic murein transglycosylase n=1 Tax=Sporosarcina sp. Te-1 TaxID=2818390 RepID=UPI001FB0B886|nr:lytic murein transglycosylase [Sporosarcina sp. Te-1]
MEFIKDPKNIAKFGGYGVDGDGDGIADPWNIQDAIFSAAHYLSKSGYKSGDDSAIRKALLSYNQDSSYVSQVFNRGQMFQGNMATGDVGPQRPLPRSSGLMSKRCTILLDGYTKVEIYIKSAH